MGTIKIVGGDYREGRAAYDHDGLTLRDIDGKIHSVPSSDILSITEITKERRSTFVDKFIGVAGGGIVGGIAAGAMAGGLTGPAGAALGAVAGATLAVRRSFVTCRIDLADGTKIVATARKDAWAAIKSAVPGHRQLKLSHYR